MTDIAQREGRSLSDLVREIIKHYLDRQDRERQLQQELEAIRALTQIREQSQVEYDAHPVDLLEEVRTERDQDMEQTRKGQP